MSKRFLLSFVFSFIIFLGIAPSVLATDYYWRGDGSDSNAGTGSAANQAFKTPAKAGSMTFQAGDTLNFQGGTTFTGRVYIGPTSVGTAASPIQIRSFGTGRAIIKNTSDNALFVYNTSGIYVHDINFEGPGSAYNNTIDGLGFYTDKTNTKLPFIKIENVKISGWTKHGMYIGSGNISAGFKDVTITSVEATDNVQSGIYSYGPATKIVHENINVNNSTAHDNPGRAGLSNHSGNGIMLSGVKGGTIEYNKAWNNGTLHSYCGAGPVGIWAFDASDLTFQFNESYGNKTNECGLYDGADGGGFDIEGGTNVTFQYNYSHNNDGAGFGLYQYAGAAPWSNNTVRYNISVNDGRKNDWYGGISIWAANGETMNGADVYNNTVYMSQAGLYNSGIANLVGPNDSGVANNFRFRNNNIYVTNGVKLLRFDKDGSGMLFQGNNYHAVGTFNITWKGNTYSSLDAWRATGQEKLNGTNVGSQVNPLLVSPGGVGVDSYKLQSSSPLINTGLNLPSVFAINVGTRDYFGTTIPVGVYDVGFHEYSGVVSSPTPTVAPTATPPVNSCKSADINRDGIVDITDYSLLVIDFFKATPANPRSDINTDGIVDITDYSLLVSQFLQAGVCL